MRKHLLIVAAVLTCCACMTPSAKQRLAASPATSKTQNEVSRPAAVSSKVRVLLSGKISKATITSSGEYLISADGKEQRGKQGSISISASGGSVKVGGVTSQNAIIITPLNGTVFTFNKNKYSSTLVIHPAKNTFDLVEILNLEKYLYGVLPYEMSPSFPLEALKAQAVAARTYTVKNMEKPLSKNYDLSASHIVSQVYKGAATVYPSVKEAVDGTKNKVLKYQGKTFLTYYHANCGGHGTDPGVWNDNPQIKPLSGAKCSYCASSKSHSWQYLMPQKNISVYAGGAVKSISVAEKMPHGHATYINIETNKGTKKVRCNNMRIALGPNKIKSCFFTKIEARGDNFYFEGRGFGHGMGMCQEGARGMANNGKNFKEILSNFFPGAELADI